MSDGEFERLRLAKNRVQSEISELEQELDHLRHLLTVIENQMTQKGFREAKAPQEPTPAPQAVVEKAPSTPSLIPPSFEQIISLKAMDGFHLASLYLGKNELKVVPVEEIAFKVTTPPFQQFLITKVLNGMVEKDREEAVAGFIDLEEILSYRIRQDGDILKEIIIRNLGDEQRTVTVRNSIRWTLEKMHEKMKL
ncbi:MAG: hypothetical protein ABIH76_05705 [Candidatus Bathyarchaeota archaeon]